MIITKLFDKVKQDVERNQKRSWFRPSEGGKCRRQIAYNMLGYEKKDLPPEKILLLEDGKLHHSAMRRQLATVVKLTSVEKEYTRTFKKGNTKITVIGHPDGVVDKKSIIEIKGISHFIYKEIQKTREAPDYYKIQANLYAWLAGLHKIIILLKNKNNSNFLELPYDRDNGLIKYALRRFIDVQKALKKKKIPPRDFALGSKECYYCDFFTECWKGSQKSILEAPGKNREKMVDLEKKDPEGKELYKLAVRLETIRQERDDVEERYERNREAAIKVLKGMKATGAVVGKYTVKASIVVRNVADKNKIREMINQGLIKMKPEKSMRVTVDNKEDRDE